MTSTLKKIFRTLIYLLVFYGLVNLSFFIFHGVKNNPELHQADSQNWIATSTGALHINTYKNIHSPDSINLVIVIHGDAPFVNPEYQYLMAKKLASKNKNTVAIGILRPGYTDSGNNTSNGVKGFTTGDNYTPSVINEIAELILQLKKMYHPINTILIGHSGGSAISGDLIGMNPDLVDKAVLVSCPSNVPKWRKYMFSRQLLNLLWLFPAKSISPLDVAGNISERTEVVIIVGEKDETTPLFFSREYHEKLISLNKHSKLVIIPGKGHEILMDEMVENEVRLLMK